MNRNLSMNRNPNRRAGPRSGLTSTCTDVSIHASRVCQAVPPMEGHPIETMTRLLDMARPRHPDVSAGAGGHPRPFPRSGDPGASASRPELPASSKALDLPPRPSRFRPVLNRTRACHARRSTRRFRAHLENVRVIISRYRHSYRYAAFYATCYCRYPSASVLSLTPSPSILLIILALGILFHDCRS